MSGADVAEHRPSVFAVRVEPSFLFVTGWAYGVACACGGTLPARYWWYGAMRSALIHVQLTRGQPYRDILGMLERERLEWPDELAGTP